MPKLPGAAQIRTTSDSVERLRKTTMFGYESRKTLNIRSVKEGLTFPQCARN